jgi:hypothetical protein
MALTLPHSFSNNTVAEAAEVNANFNAVKLFTDALQDGSGIDNLVITNSKIATSAVTEVKLAASAVTESKLADRSVGSTKLTGAGIVPVTAGTYTFLVSDAHKVVTFANACTVTIPAGGFVVGDQINILQIGAGQVAVSNAGVTLRLESSRNKTRGQWAMATLIQIASNEWVLVGNVVA